MITLSEALDAVYGERRGKYRSRKHDWTNPIEGMGYVSGVFQTPYEAYQQLKPGYQKIVRNLIGREPEPHDDLVGENAYKNYELLIDAYGRRSQKKALEKAKALESTDG